MRRVCVHSGKGSVLIFALWVLLFLTVLAVNIGVGTRQKIHLLQRLDTRSQLRLAAEAGIKTAVAVLVEDVERTQFNYSAMAKKIRHNNPVMLQRILVGDATADVSYDYFERADYGSEKMYGAVDEESKLNVNTVDLLPLRVLIQNVLGMQPDEARGLAESIIDWRLHGTGSIEGFYSDGYYSGLKYAYPKKSALFESLHELLLVRGMNRERYERLRPFLTVYGNGLVNVNTASIEVLIALGLEEETASKWVDARQGPDGIEHTEDDHVFYRTYDIASEINEIYEITPKERSQIDAINSAHLIGTISDYYTIRSEGSLDQRPGESKIIEAVYNTREKLFVYWFEK